MLKFALHIKKLNLPEPKTSYRQKCEKWLKAHHPPLYIFKPCGLNEDKWNWIEKRDQLDLPAIPFIVPYCQTGTKAGEIVKSHFAKIKEEYDWIYKQKPITAFTRHANLKNLLVSTKLRRIAHRKLMK